MVVGREMAFVFPPNFGFKINYLNRIRKINIEYMDESILKY